MSHIYTSADQLIGHTLLELTHLEKKYGLKAGCWASWSISTPPAP